MFLEELIEQHRVHLIVAHAARFSLFVASHQLGINLFYVLSDESEPERTRRFDLRLVSKAHGLELVNYFAGFLHRLDLVLEAP
jgi:hypothetical protein